MSAPSGWQPQVIGDGAKLLSGQHVAAEDYSEDARDGIPYLTGPSDFADGHIVVSKYTSRPRVICSPGDILITVKGSGTGKIVRSDAPYCISRQLMAVRATRWNPDFLYYCLSHNSTKYGNDAAGLIPGITRQDVLNTPVLIPPPPEQRKIAEILGTWDEAIGLLERRIAAARERKKGLMQRLLTGQVRFPGYGPAGERRTVGRWSVPADWLVARIADIAHEVRHRNRHASTIPVLSCTKHQGLVDSKEYFGRQVFSDDVSEYKLVSRGQFVYATNHIEEGSIGYQDLYDQALVSPMYTAFETNHGVDDRFLYSLLKSEAYRHEFAITTSGTVNRRGALRWSEFSQIRIGLPSASEQRAIAGVLAVCDEETELLTRKVSALQEQKKGLMQRLLTGQVRATALLEADLERAVPIHRELAGLGWVPETADVSQRIVSICDFLGIESLAETATLRRAARQTRTREPLRIAEIAWGKRVERLARQQKVGPYLPAALRDAIPDLLRYAQKPADVARVPSFLAKYGVHFVILRHLKQTYLDGALLYTDENPIIALTLRHKQLDRFWFTLMHELAHLLLGHEGIYLDTIDEPSDPTEDEEEREANRQAEDWLIDRAAIKRLGQNRHLSYADVARFAQERGLHPSIVAGRIRHERGNHRLFRKLDATITGELDSWVGDAEQAEGVADR